MSILVTGGAGFLGRYVARRLVEEGERPVLFDAQPSASAVDDIIDQVDLIPGDLLDLSRLLDVIRRHRVDRIVHLGFVLAPVRGLSQMFEVNCMGTVNVFEAARLSDVERVVYASSVWVWPERRTLTGPLMHEDDPAAPDHDYGYCKVFNEYTAAEYEKVHGLSTVGLRFTAVYGPGRGARQGMNPRHYMTAPEHVLRGEQVTMPPDDQVVDWLYVEDAAACCVQALRAGSLEHSVFNVRADQRPVGDLTAYLRSAVPGAKITTSDEPFSVCPLMDVTRMSQELKFTPRYDLEAGMAEYLGRSQAHRD